MEKLFTLIFILSLLTLNSIAQKNVDSTTVMKKFTAGDCLIKSYELKKTAYLFTAGAVFCSATAIYIEDPQALMVGAGVLGLGALFFSVRANLYIGKAGARLNRAGIGLNLNNDGLGIAFSF